MRNEVGKVRGPFPGSIQRPATGARCGSRRAHLRVIEHHQSGKRELGAFTFAVVPQPGHGFQLHSAAAGGWEQRYTASRIEHRFDANAPDDPATVIVVRRDWSAI